MNTELIGKGLQTFGEDIDDYADDLFKKLENDENIEIGYEFSEIVRLAGREEVGEYWELW